MITNSPTSKTSDVPPLVKIRDVASYLSCSRWTVHKLIDSGHLQASEINPATPERRHVRITRTSLLTFYKKRFGHSLDRALAHAYEP
jgi:excisionase family DNA binding protein